jgi:Dak1 domain
MGIHGEPGREQRELPDADNAGIVVGDILCEGILGSEEHATAAGLVAYPARLKLEPSDQVAVLLNNLGALPAIEMLIVARTVMLNLKRRGLKPVRAFVGPYVTALDMTGVSLSIIRVSDSSVLERLDALTAAPAWVVSSKLDIDNASAAQSIPYDENVLHSSIFGGYKCPSAGKVIRAVCQRIIEIEPLITEYDAICGDGDCGLVMKGGAIKVLADLTLQQVRNITQCNSIIPTLIIRTYASQHFSCAVTVTRPLPPLSQDAYEADSAALCDRLADSISASMGGTSGALLEIFFRATASFMSTKVSDQQRSS